MRLAYGINGCRNPCIVGIVVVGCKLDLSVARNSSTIGIIGNVVRIESGKIVDAHHQAIAVNRAGCADSSSRLSIRVHLLHHYSLKICREHELLKGRDVRVINNAVDTTIYRPVPKAEARLRLGLSKDNILIAFATTYMSERRKGLDKLSEAVARIGNPRIKIVAVGKNIHHRSWPNVIEMGFKDTAESLCEVFSACDFFSMPSMQEAFALTPMQAMACGLPVVAFPVSGTSELINEHNGVVCTDFTVEALQEGIMTLMSRHHDAAAIRQDMVNRFSPVAIAQKYCCLYNDLLLRSSGNPAPGQSYFSL